MGTKLDPTLLATSKLPLDLSTGFKTLKTSIDAVAYDKDFTVCNWSFKIEVPIIKKVLVSASLNIAGRLFIGVAGPSYALTCEPTMEYTDGTLSSTTEYTWCEKKKIWGIPTVECGLSSDTQPSGSNDFNVLEIDSKHIPRNVTVDSWGNTLTYGGFVMGIWLFASIDGNVDFFGKKASFIGQTQTNLLQDAIVAAVTIAYLASGDPLAAEGADTSVTNQITSALKTQAKYTVGEDAVGLLDGQAFSFFDSVTSSLDDKDGFDFDPKCALNLNLLSFVPYFSTLVGAAAALGLSIMFGPYVTIHFPVHLTLASLAVNGQFGGISGWGPVTADVGPTNTADGSPGTVSVADPSLSTPKTVGIGLDAVPGVDLEVGFTASISYGHYFNEGWTVDLKTDITAAINELLGTIPSSVNNTLQNDVGSTKASTVKKG